MRIPRISVPFQCSMARRASPKTPEAVRSLFLLIEASYRRQLHLRCPRTSKILKPKIISVGCTATAQLMRYPVQTPEFYRACFSCATTATIIPTRIPQRSPKAQTSADPGPSPPLSAGVLSRVCIFLVTVALPSLRSARHIFLVITSILIVDLCFLIPCHSQHCHTSII